MTSTKTPEITVFMAAYNASNYIAESIQTVLDQTFLNFELLIVNDGSTDDTISVVNRFKDPRIRLINNPVNRGISFTRNIALSEAKGRYLAILDSDDLAVSNRLELQYLYFQANPDLAACGGHASVINSRGQPSGDKMLATISLDDIRINLLFHNTFINSTVMVKTRVLKELNGYQDFAPVEDYDFFIRAAENYQLANLNEILVNYRVHDLNTSKLKSAEKLSHIYKIKHQQLTSLCLENENRLIPVLVSILTSEYGAFKFSDYLDLFYKLKLANEAIGKYPKAAFERKLFSLWFEIIMKKEATMNALALLFNRRLFSWEYITYRQIRKVFKRALKGVGR